MTTIGMIGLGVMGLAMAQNLQRSGFGVCGYDIDPSRRKLLKKAKATVGQSVQEVAENADVLISSLPSTESLLSVSHSLASTGHTTPVLQHPSNQKNRHLPVWS